MNYIFVQEFIFSRRPILSIMIFDDNFYLKLLLLTAATQVSYSMRVNFLGGQNKGLIRPGDDNPPQMLKLCNAEHRFVPKIELLSCNVLRNELSWSCE